MSAGVVDNLNYGTRRLISSNVRGSSQISTLDAEFRYEQTLVGPAARSLGTDDFYAALKGPRWLFNWHTQCDPCSLATPSLSVVAIMFYQNPLVIETEVFWSRAGLGNGQPSTGLLGPPPLTARQMAQREWMFRKLGGAYPDFFSPQFEQDMMYSFVQIATMGGYGHGLEAAYGMIWHEHPDGGLAAPGDYYRAAVDFGVDVVTALAPSFLGKFGHAMVLRGIGKTTLRMLEAEGCVITREFGILRAWGSESRGGRVLRSWEIEGRTIHPVDVGQVRFGPDGRVIADEAAKVHVPIGGEGPKSAAGTLDSAPYKIVLGPNGELSIQFDARLARQASVVDRGYGTEGTPETLAVLTNEGKVLVLEGKHRLNAVAIDGKTVAESVPGKPYWLEYIFSRTVSSHEGFPPGWGLPLNKKNPLANPANPWEYMEGY